MESKQPVTDQSALLLAGWSGTFLFEHVLSCQSNLALAVKE